MHMPRLSAMLAGALLFAGPAFAQQAPNVPTAKDGTFVAKDFKFSTGETFPELRIAYKTLGDPRTRRFWCCTAPAAPRPTC